MKCHKLFVGIAAFATLLSLGGCSVVGGALEKAMRMQSDYYKEVAPGAELERIYTGLGPLNVQSLEFQRNGVSYKVWFPMQQGSEHVRYPAVVMANGSGTRYPAYEATFEHLATWGFVVIGDDVDSTATGETVAALVDQLDRLEAENGPLQGKVDLSKIGVSGHSQGAVGAVNAATKSKNAGRFKSLYLASMTAPQVIENLKWTSWRYDVSGVRVPAFILAGTGSSDSESIAPLASLNKNFDAIGGSSAKVVARRKATEHGAMLRNADGYMTAWFRYTLANDARASGVFAGRSPEISSNTLNWQDVRLR